MKTNRVTNYYLSRPSDDFLLFIAMNIHLSV